MEADGDSEMIQPLEWTGKSLRVVDQTKLPGSLVKLELKEYDDVIEAIKSLRVRGAPVIGIAAAYGIALGARSVKAANKFEFMKKLEVILKEFAGSRPTAVDLFHAIKKMRLVASESELRDVRKSLLTKAVSIHELQKAATEKLSRYGAGLIQDGATVLTHCNAGPLATAGTGTALGIIMTAVKQGKKVSVFADETRPLLQGARLTAWELKQEGIPVTVITDSMAGHMMKRGMIDCVIVGADRVTANGDFANKIGTYTVAVMAQVNRVPFYVAAPLSTFDFSLTSGGDIPIEERSNDEVTHIRGLRIAPRGVPARNPAFDVTPSEYVTAIITERGIITAPNRQKLRKIAKEAK
jgi:methylthioribose-1-phosphate isomerase